MMMSTLLACLVIAAPPSLDLFVQTPANFTGTWTLDRGRSEGVPPGVEMTMTVKQSGDRVEIETKISSPLGQQTIPDVYVLDGQETDYVAPAIGPQTTGKGRRTSRWVAAKDGFDVSERAVLEGPDGKVEMRAARTWTLASDGKTLTIDMTVSGPKGDATSKRVFVRK